MKINFNAPLNTQTSYGLTSLNFVEALSKLGHTVRAFPIGSVSYYPFQTNILPSIKRGELMVREEHEYIPSCSVRLYHQFSLFEHISDTHIGFPIFELDNFTEQEKASINYCDELIVCSEWARGIINHHFSTLHCSVVPLGVDSSIFYPTEPSSVIDGKEKPFTFFFPGKFEYRKGFDIVMDVFDKAFTNENIEVIFLPQNLFIKDNDDWARSLMSSKLGKRGRVKILPPLEAPQHVAELIRYSDAVVSFSRAEGWNLPLLEALACGRQVLATNYSGQTEFLNRNNAVLLDVDGREDAIDGVFFNGQGQWLSYTENDLKNFAYHLYEVYRRGRKYNEEGVKTAKEFSWENSARKLVNVLC